MCNIKGLRNKKIISRSFLSSLCCAQGVLAVVLKMRIKRLRLNARPKITGMSEGNTLTKYHYYSAGFDFR